MNGSGTRSSLMYETLRIVNKLKPKYVIWENVKNILSKKHKHNFDRYVDIMNEGGYTSYYQVLDAKDYGIPQHRERVFVISILKETKIYDDHHSNIRQGQNTIGTLTTNCGSSAIRNGWKIIEYQSNFIFPQKEELKLRLKDMLEEQVDEKYYSIAPCLTARGAGEEHGGMVTYCNNLDNTTDMQEECLKIKNNTKQGYDIATIGDSVNLQQPNSETRRGRVGHEVSQTLQTSASMGTIDEKLRIRKLTPKECWRLMGFTDEEFEKAAQVNSNSQLYKQAGNSIVVNVLEKILKNLIGDKNVQSNNTDEATWS